MANSLYECYTEHLPFFGIFDIHTVSDTLFSSLGTKEDSFLVRWTFLIGSTL